jgi:hypothetical protein
MRACVCALVCGLAIVVQCGQFCVQDAEPALEPSIALSPVEDVTSGSTRIDVAGRDPAPNLKSAMLRLWCGCCGTECDSPELHYCSSVVQAASREQLLMAYTDIISDPRASSVSRWEIGHVASLAAKLPLWPAFRDALRKCRDYLPNDDRLLFEVFGYFAVHGEWSDLEWLWQMANCEDNTRRLVGFATIRKLRTRLQAQGE